MSLSKPLPILPDMPWNVKQLIVDSTNTITKASLEQCAKEYKSYVENTKVLYEGLYIYSKIKENSITVRLVIDNDTSVSWEFHSRPNGYIVKRYSLAIGEKETEKTVENENFVDAAIDRFSRILRKPNTVLKTLDILIMSPEVYEGVLPTGSLTLRKIQTVFNSTSQNLQIEGLSVRITENATDVIPMLSCFKPETFRFMLVENMRSDFMQVVPEFPLESVCDLEQWRKLKKINLGTYNQSLPISKWIHFNFLRFRKTELSLADFKVMVDSFINNKNFEYCELRCDRFDHRSFLEHIFHFSPVITGVIGKSHRYIFREGFRLKFAFPNDMDYQFEVRIKSEVMEFLKVYEGPKIRAGPGSMSLEEFIGSLHFFELTASKAMEDIEKFLPI